MYIALPLFLLFIYAIYTGYFKKNCFKFNNLINNKKIVFVILLFAFFWCYFAGLGGLWYQSSDYHWRNAIFRDLIIHNWPLYYQSYDFAIVYYIGHWLPVALCTKIFLLISTDVAFFIGNIFLLLYSAFGIFLVFVHVLKAAEVKTYSKVCLAILMMIMFSGMDIIGVLYPTSLMNPNFISEYMHLEWWSIEQFSSFTTILFWVFNQGIIAWLTTLMFYNNKNKIEDFGVIAICCFFCSPLPFMGLLPFLLVYAINFIFKVYKQGTIKKHIATIFSVQNIISILLVSPIICLYFISNHSIEINGIVNSVTNNNVVPITSVYDFNFLSLIVYFFILEVGIYFILISKQYKYELLYYIAFVFLLLCPFIRIGYGIDFCMRASIPSILILFVMIIKFLFNYYNFRKYRIRYMILCCCLIIGSFTPVIEFSRGVKDIIKNGQILRVADDMKTLEGNLGYDQDGNPINGNFVTEHPKEKFFFKYLARK